jgi:ribosomal protein S18 acetylase RimI-like enzyme
MADNTVRLVVASSVPPADLRACLLAAFADYLIPIAIPAESWGPWLAQQGVELGESRVAVGGDGQPVALAFVAPRPSLRRWRLAGMGVLPNARGSGVARALLQDLIARAVSAGQSGVELEVFAQNARARALYERQGFAPRHELHGFRATAWNPSGAADERTSAAAGPTPAVQAVTRDEALQWLLEREAALGDLPLQAGPTSLRAREGWQAWRLGDAQVVLLPKGDKAWAVASLVDRSEQQRDAEALLRDVGARLAGMDWIVPQLQREDLGGAALRRLGFKPEPLHQLWMLRVL